MIIWILNYDSRHRIPSLANLTEITDEKIDAKLPRQSDADAR